MKPIKFLGSEQNRPRYRAPVVRHPLLSSIAVSDPPSQQAKRVIASFVVKGFIELAIPQVICYEVSRSLIIYIP